jgi:hypothetical protein
MNVAHDTDAGVCPACDTPTVASILWLAGIV